MPEDFTGLSYEAGQLYNPDFFSPQNAALIQTFRQLTPQGILRLGGHLSNITPWEGVGRDEARQQRGVQHGIEDYWEWPLVDPSIQKNKHGMITRRALQNLRGFLDATNYRLLYTLNFASGSPARAADEAAAVSQIMGDRLVAFLIGNEVDGYGQDKFFRPPNYTFDQFFTEYQAWVAAVRTKVPHAPFAGPDTDGHMTDWVLPFAQRAGKDVVLLTSHFYGMGPASDPTMTADRLLAKSNPRLEAEIHGAHAAIAAAGGTRYRMDEGNSCFGGGRPGVSDAYASALWAADYMLRAASEGFAGANLHGGGIGVYTPIESSEQAAAEPRPVFYGMQFAQHLAGSTVARCELTTNQNVTAYAGVATAHRKLAIINKGDHDVRLLLKEIGLIPDSYNALLLRGSALDAKSGVTLKEHAEFAAPVAPVLPAYSAVLLTADF